ncbi:mRNA splicing protein prp18, partial [Chytridiales sp. JEL 0842]
MDFLKAEIEKKRKAIQEVTSVAGTATKKRYLKRGEVEAIQEQQLHVSKAPEKPAASAVKDDQPTIASDSSSNAANPNDSNKPTELEEDVDEELHITVEDLVSRFRARGEPIRLFAETFKQRVRRLRTLESMEERTDGQTNMFKTMLENTDKGLALELLAKQAGLTVEEFEKRNRKKGEKDEDSIDVSIISPELLESDPEKTRYLIG